MKRRTFLGGLCALGTLGGCKSLGLAGGPNLRFGVISDPHVTTPESCELLEKAFVYFKSRGVDAVVVPGDLTDYGTETSLRLLRATWDKVFAGTATVPLFCTGNHDFDGWEYCDMAVDMYAVGQDGRDALRRTGMATAWKRTFGTDWAPVRVRQVKGYDFVSVEFKAGKTALADWMAAHGERLKGAKPFFHFQHLPAKGTTMDSMGWADNGVTKPVLSRFPNCVSFTGHTHTPFNDERAIWQGEYTAITVPSLSYAGIPGGYENGDGDRFGKSIQAMPFLTDRLDLRGGQGFVVNVYDDEMVIERRDFEEETDGAEPWVVPLGAGASKPYAYAAREKTTPAPVFPAGSTLRTRTGNTENRQGKWTIVQHCSFPSATMPDGTRVHDYEIRAVPLDGSAPLVKRFLSPAYSKLSKYEPRRLNFWFDVKELPIESDFVLEVRARNCFGKCSPALVSKPRRVNKGIKIV